MMPSSAARQFCDDVLAGGVGHRCPWPVMPKAAFLGLAGEIVRVIDPHTESDPAALLMTFLTCFGNSIGRGPHYRVESTDHGPNLFALIVGNTAKARKGTSADRI